MARAAKPKTPTYPDLPPDAAVAAFLKRDFRKKSAEFLTFTPALCSFLLKYFNRRDRGVIPSAYESYGRDMAATRDDGRRRWINDTTDAIGFVYFQGGDLTPLGNPYTTPGVQIDPATGLIVLDETGLPIVTFTGPRVAKANGQHRLGAGALNGHTFSQTFLQGLHPDAIFVVDSGEKRKRHHQLELSGTPEAKRSDAIVVALDLLHKRKPRKISATELEEIMHPLQASLQWALAALPAIPEAYGAPQILAAFLYAYTATANDRATQLQVEDIAYRMRTAQGCAEDHPIYRFRNYCVQRRESLGKRTGPRKKASPAYQLTLQTLNAIMLTMNGMTMKPLDPDRRLTWPDNNNGYLYFSKLAAKATAETTSTANADSTAAATAELP